MQSRNSMFAQKFHTVPYYCSGSMWQQALRHASSSRIGALILSSLSPSPSTSSRLLPEATSRLSSTCACQWSCWGSSSQQPQASTSYSSREHQPQRHCQQHTPQTSSGPPHAPSLPQRSWPSGLPSTTAWGQTRMPRPWATALSTPWHGLSPSSIPRSFAKKAAAAAASSGGGSRATTSNVFAPQKRRSNMRVFSCRNDRFRSAFEQIWPTLRLTEAESQLFKRNSRLFVIETGKAISLKTKFELSRPTDALAGGPSASVKPNYADARIALFESQLHLDSVGEQPRYMKIRRVRNQFGLRLQNIRKVRLLLGFARRGYLQKLYEHTQVQAGTSKVWKLVCALESRLGMFALRMGLAHDAIVARDMVRTKVHLNGTPPALKDAYTVQVGDVLTPTPGQRAALEAQVALSMGSLVHDVHRDFLL